MGKKAAKTAAVVTEAAAPVQDTTAAAAFTDATMTAAAPAAASKSRKAKKAAKAATAVTTPVTSVETAPEAVETPAPAPVKAKRAKKAKAAKAEEVETPAPATEAPAPAKTKKEKKAANADTVETPAVQTASAKADKAAAVAPAAPNALADMFAQSSSLFAKKTSYVQASKPTDAASSKRKRTANNDTATNKPARALDGDDIDEDEAAADAAEQSLVLPEPKKPKKKKHKVLAREAAEAAAAAASVSGAAATATETSAEPAVDSSNATANNASDKSARTIFVGNVSLDATQKDIMRLFAPCGKVESVRLRSMPLAGCAVDQPGNQKLMMKVCANKKLLLETRESCNAYVTFATIASVKNALALNGTQLLHRAIRVDVENPVVDPKRSVFVGNLGFQLADETLRKFFINRLASDEAPAPVENVRIIRDRTTGAGKGFAYVLLASAALAAQALALNDAKLDNRPIRVQVCGKRFKNNKGEAGENAKPKHEGVRASAGAKARVAAKKKAHGINAVVDKFKMGAKATPGAHKLAGVASSSKKIKPKHAARKAAAGATTTTDSNGAKAVFKKPPTATNSKSKGPVGAKQQSFRSGKPSVSKPKVKVAKPKHAARKARQAAEAAAGAK